jgi:hypothetical protein
VKFRKKVKILKKATFSIKVYHFAALSTIWVDFVQLVNFTTKYMPKGSQKIYTKVVRKFEPCSFVFFELFQAMYNTRKSTFYRSFNLKQCSQVLRAISILYPHFQHNYWATPYLKEQLFVIRTLASKQIDFHLLPTQAPK